MDINASSVIRHPRERVYAAYRDELERIAAFMPNIKEIIIRKRDVADGHVRLHNEWVGKGEVPKIAQGLIRPEMVRWDDYADWDDANSLCRWTLKTRVFTDKVDCKGTNRIVAEGPSSTRVILSGTLDLDLKEIPGVPRILASRIKPQVEGFIIALIRPNLEQVNQALERYLDANR